MPPLSPAALHRSLYLTAALGAGETEGIVPVARTEVLQVYVQYLRYVSLMHLLYEEMCYSTTVGPYENYFDAFPLGATDGDEGYLRCDEAARDESTAATALASYHYPLTLEQYQFNYFLELVVLRRRGLHPPPLHPQDLLTSAKPPWAATSHTAASHVRGCPPFLQASDQEAILELTALADYMGDSTLQHAAAAYLSTWLMNATEAEVLAAFVDDDRGEGNGPQGLSGDARVALLAGIRKDKSMQLEAYY